MDTILLWIIGSTLLVSVIALIGVVTLAIKGKVLDKILLILVGFSAGGLMGGAFLHLLPEALEKSNNMNVYLFLLFGFSIFFILERVLYWHHCHDGVCDVHTFTYMNLIGDGIHNFIDGLIMAAAYVTSIPIGIITTFIVIFHEIPQEIGDFGVLVYGGFSRIKALTLNFLTGLSAILGGVIGYFLSSYVEKFTIFLLPFAAGGFIYIAASDLIPELHKQTDIKKSLVSFLFFLFGIGIMTLIKLLFS